MRRMLMLAGSLLVLALGPILVARVRNLRPATVALDAFVVVAIGGLILIHILPESLDRGGWAALAALVAGLFGPLLAERGLRPGTTSGAGRIVIGLALAGLAAHAMIDGLALGHDHAASHHGHDHAHDHEPTGLLALAVLLHRLPVGIAIWWLIPRTLGVRVAIGTLVLIAASTVFGFALGGVALDEAAGSQGLAIFQALLAGSLLHVVFHSHLPVRERSGSWELASAMGTIAAIAILAAVSASHPSAVVSQAGAVFLAFALQSAPALLAAYLVVGFIHVLLPAKRLEGGTGGPLRQAARGVIAGLPLPVCSCGIVPLYRELVLKGAPVAAAMAFLIATPELEIAAFLLTMQLMGTPFAVARIAAAAVLALLAGWLVGRAATVKPVASADVGVPEPEPQRTRRSPAGVLRDALRFGFGEAVDHTAAWILLGLGIAALVSPYLDKDWLIGVPPILQVACAALLGLPLYVCASGSTPFAASLVAYGLSPGAAIALLLTGPATNVTTFGLLSDLHGSKTAITFGVLIIVGAIGLGVAVDGLLETPDIAPVTNAGHAASTLAIGCLSVLALVFLVSLLRQGTRPFIERVAVSRDGHDHGHDHADSPPPPCCD